jgi:xanthine dehydrogenase accessory factor
MEPAKIPNMSQEVLTELVKALERGDEVALVTIVAAQGSTPQRVGAKMLVYPDGRISGTIGGGCYENDALYKAKEALIARKPRLVKYDLTDDFAEESGLICGGQMTVYIEPVEAAPQLYIVGAGHVGHQLAHVARPVGFRIHVLDDREKFANAERFPEADEIIVDSIPDWLHKAEIPPSAYVVVVTRGHRHDLDALRSLAARDLRYIGLIGSKAKVKKIYDALVEEGMPIECLSRIHAPIGLDIGAVSPEEIAVSILAELIAVRRGRIDEPHVAGASLQWKKLPASLAKE